jgi:signal transduction histidine kinase
VNDVLDLSKIEANQLELEQVEFNLKELMLNLIANAIKFTERGEIVVRVVSQPGALLFSVSDTGIGIPPEKHESIFQSFTQGSRRSALLKG